MWKLYQFPLCPFSRKVRLALAEKGIPFDLVRENPWDASEEFQLLNPLVRTPVLKDEARAITLVDSRAITEYLEETEDRARLINGTATDRAEIRRLVALFDYVDHLIGLRPWLAGSTFTLADIAAAAQISVVEFLGGIDWKGHKESRDWYLVIKSRRSFAPLLTERMDSLLPPADYADLNC